MRPRVFLEGAAPVPILDEYDIKGVQLGTIANILTPDTTDRTFTLWFAHWTDEAAMTLQKETVANIGKNLQLIISGKLAGIHPIEKGISNGMLPFILPNAVTQEKAMLLYGELSQSIVHIQAEFEEQRKVIPIDKDLRVIMKIGFILTLLPFCLKAEFLRLSWPTPNPAFAKGMGYSAFIQKTGPDKEFSSGVFGCVRNNGFKFHEGLDLYPVRRDAKGRAEDRVFAAMKGTVTYINTNSAYSAYGKYLVLEHSDLQPSLYSLYAHMASFEPNLRLGSTVDVAKPLGKMGNSASYPIPLERSHLHFEIGLRLTDDFQAWFSRKAFKTPNRHGNYSGFNLVGIDPIPFYASFQKKSFAKPIDYLKSLPIQAKVKIKTNKVPDFVRRYPTLAPNFKERVLIQGLGLLLRTLWNTLETGTEQSIFDPRSDGENSQFRPFHAKQTLPKIGSAKGFEPLALRSTQNLSGTPLWFESWLKDLTPMPIS